MEEEDRMAMNPDITWKQICDQQIFEDVPSIAATEAITTNSRENYTRLVIISDTHGQHRKVHLPKGDVLIHGGDFTKTGEMGTIEDLSCYFAESGFREVVVIAGNHDMTLDPDYYEKKWKNIHRTPFDCQTAQEAIERHCHYLNDSAYTSQSGLEFYGSPYSPFYYDWAFNRRRGAPLRHIWDQIPNHEDAPIDVLMTHTPPLGRGDLTRERLRAGCYNLLKAIQTRVQPRINIFGHIHEGYGTTYDGHTLFINASSLDMKYKAVNRPIVVDISHANKTEPARVILPVNTKATTQNDFEQWCSDHGYKVVAEAISTYNGEQLPLGSDLFRADAFLKLLDKLGLHRSPKGRAEVEMLLGELYAENF